MQSQDYFTFWSILYIWVNKIKLHTEVLRVNRPLKIGATQPIFTNENVPKRTLTPQKSFSGHRIKWKTILSWFWGLFEVKIEFNRLSHISSLTRLDAIHNARVVCYTLYIANSHDDINISRPAIIYGLNNDPTVWHICH